MTSTRGPVHRTVRRLAVLAGVLVLGLLPAQAARAGEDAQVAWSVSPAGADGAVDGRTRIDLTADPGAAIHDQVTVANASTVERTFRVYGADAFNTEGGGYDLQAAATPPTDVGAWVTVETPTVTIPALSAATVRFTVDVPTEATPGDHPGGIVVSLDRPPADGGVVLDTRVAVRLGVRVAGELAPTLAVRSVDASFGGSWVPFGPAAATVAYEVVNTGNVRIVGLPRVRVTGPFGTRLADLQEPAEREVLPGQSFTVTQTLAGVAPLGLLTAVVDVDSAAVPGSDVEVPLVSSTARGTFLAVPWTGLGVLVLVVAGVVLLVRYRRRRLAEGQELWDALVAEARATGTVPGGAPQIGPARAVVTMLVLGVVLGSGVASLVLPGARPSPPSQTGTLQLSVPPGPSDDDTTAPTPSAPPSSGGDGTPPPSGGHGVPPGGPGGQAPGSPSLPRGPGLGSSSTPDPAPSRSEPAAPADDETPGAAGGSKTKGADLVWRPATGWTPAQWAMVGVGGAVVAGGVATGAVHLVRLRARPPWGGPDPGGAA